MKHSLKETLEIIAWTVFCVVMAIFGYKLLSVPPIVTDIPDWTMGLIVVGVIVLSGLFWWIVLKKFKRNFVELGFASVITLLLMTFWIPDGGVTQGMATWLVVLLCILYLIAFYALVVMIISYAQLMKKSWKFTQKWYWVWNVVFLFATAIISIKFSKMLPPIAAFVFLGGAAIYDAWAVWKSGTMVDMAKFFIDSRMVPGIIVPKKKKNKFAILGGGDVFAIIVVSFSFLKTSPWFAFTTLSGMIGSLVYLMFVGKDKFYPALPFLFAGAIIGVFVGWIFW